MDNQIISIIYLVTKRWVYLNSFKIIYIIIQRNMLQKSWYYYICELKKNWFKNLIEIKSLNVYTASYFSRYILKGVRETPGGLKLHTVRSCVRKVRQALTQRSCARFAIIAPNLPYCLSIYAKLWVAMWRSRRDIQLRLRNVIFVLLTMKRQGSQ